MQEPRFDFDRAAPTQHHHHYQNERQTMTAFQRLPWLVRWAIYFVCLGVILPPLLFGCVAIIGIVGVVAR